MQSILGKKFWLSAIAAGILSMGIACGGETTRAVPTVIVAPTATVIRNTPTPVLPTPTMFPYQKVQATTNAYKSFKSYTDKWGYHRSQLGETARIHKVPGIAWNLAPGDYEVSVHTDYLWAESLGVLYTGHPKQPPVSLYKGKVVRFTVDLIPQYTVIKAENEVHILYVTIRKARSR